MEKSRINLNFTEYDIQEMLNADDDTEVFEWYPRDQHGNEIVVSICRNDDATE